jgi:hypothetical protein
LSRLSPEAKEKVTALQRELPKFVEQKQRAFMAEVGAMIEKAGKACLDAKTESDLDPIVAALGALRKQRADTRDGFSEARQRLNTRLDGAIRFVNRWQDYLAQAGKGFDGAARNVLRELADPSGNQSNYPILPRDQIVARLGKELAATADDVIRTTKTLDEIPKAIAELSRMSREGNARFSGGTEFSAPLNELRQIARAHSAFQAGNYGSALLTAAQWEGTGGIASPESMRLKTMLLFEVLPRYLELPDNPKPNAGENPSEFLLRLAGEAVQNNDWTRVARVLDAYRLTGFGYRQPPSWVAVELDACQQFMAAQNLDKAGQYGPAILAYQRSLKGSGQYSPKRAATQRLRELEKEQPAAFAEATKAPEVRELLEVLRSIAPRVAPVSTSAGQ